MGRGVFLNRRFGRLRICALSLPTPRAGIAVPSISCTGTWRSRMLTGHWLHHHNLRYDLTVIPSCEICGEWVKTKGHYHPKNPAGIGYPEIYEVIEGQVHYLLQSRNLDDVVIISAQAGDLVIIPPEYGHVSINPSQDSALVMANIVSTAFESEYGRV